MGACLICGADLNDVIQAWASGICRECVAVMSCWRCGAPTRGWWPYLLCEPCVDRVTPAEIERLNDATYQPGRATWEMTPMYRENAE